MTTTMSVVAGSGLNTVFRKPLTRERQRELSGNRPGTRYHALPPTPDGILQSRQTLSGLLLSTRSFRRSVPRG